MKIYVLGDSGIDNYHIGRVRGLSAEVPIPILDITERAALPAMAGNVVANLAALGADVVELRGAEKSPRQGIASLSSLPTAPTLPSKNRLVTESGTQLARWDENDHCEALGIGDLVPLMHADAIIVADYGKGAVTPQVVEVLKGVTLPVFVDTKQDPKPWIGSKAILFPNLAEYKQFEDSYQWIARVVLKLGAAGIAYLEYGKVIFTRPAYAASVQCVNGAGDTVIAAFALAHLAGLLLPRALEFASAAAALVVEQPVLERTTSTAAVLERLTGEDDAGDNWGSTDSAGDSTVHPVAAAPDGGTQAHVGDSTPNQRGRAVTLSSSGIRFEEPRFLTFPLTDGPIN